MHLKDLFAFVFAAVSGGNLVGHDQGVAPPVHSGVPDSGNSFYTARPNNPFNSPSSKSSADTYGANNPYGLNGPDSSTDPSGTSDPYDPDVLDSSRTDTTDTNNPYAPQSSAAANAASNPYSPYASNSPTSAQGAGNPYIPYPSNSQMGGQDGVNPYDPLSLRSSRNLYGASRQYDPYARRSTDGFAASRPYNPYQNPYDANAPSGPQSDAYGGAPGYDATGGLAAGSGTNYDASQSLYLPGSSSYAGHPTEAFYGQDPTKGRERKRGWGDSIYDPLAATPSGLSSSGLPGDPYDASAYSVAKPRGSELSGDPSATLGLNPLYPQGAFTPPRGSGAPPTSQSDDALGLGGSISSRAPASPFSATVLGGGALGNPLASPSGPVSPSLGQTVPGAIQ